MKTPREVHCRSRLVPLVPRRELPQHRLGEWEVGLREVASRALWPAVVGPDPVLGDC